MRVCHYGFRFPAQEESTSSLVICPLFTRISTQSGLYPPREDFINSFPINSINRPVSTAAHRPVPGMTTGNAGPGSTKLENRVAGIAAYQTSKPPEFKTYSGGRYELDKKGSGNSPDVVQFACNGRVPIKPARGRYQLQ